MDACKHPLTCTQCQFHGEVLLEVPTEAVLTECPRCGQALLLTEGRTQAIDLETAQSLQESGNDVKGRLRTTQKRGMAMLDTEFTAETSLGHKPPAAHVPRDHVISKDEIVDMIIDLETTVDVQDFIARM